MMATQPKAPRSNVIQFPRPSLRESAKQLTPLIEEFRAATEMLEKAEKAAELIRVETEHRASLDVCAVAKAAGVSPSTAMAVLVGVFGLEPGRRDAVVDGVKARVKRLKGGR
jgi:hypothetical protein